jgi:hypothetical protein
MDFHRLHPVPDEIPDTETRGIDIPPLERLLHLVFPDFNGGLIGSEFEGALLGHVVAVYGEGFGFANVHSVGELVDLFGFVFAVETLEGLAHELQVGGFGHCLADRWDYPGSRGLAFGEEHLGLFGGSHDDIEDCPVSIVDVVQRHFIQLSLA